MRDPAEAVARAAAEKAARQSYGKLVAYLAAGTRDVAGAEDALAEAFAEALRRWMLVLTGKVPTMEVAAEA